MAAPKKTIATDDYTDTILGPESSFEGKLVFNGGQVRIEGRFKGEVQTESTLIVGESAHVEGTLDVGTVIIHGKVEGDVLAHTSVGIERPATVRGTITTPELMIQKGVIFEGSCKMVEASKSSSTSSGASKVTALPSAADSSSSSPSS